MQYKDVTPIIAELVRLKNSIPLKVDIGRRLPEVRKNTHGEAVRSGLKKALRVIEQAPAVTAMPRWISVEERMPAPHEDVAIIIRQGGYTYLRVGWYGCACQWMQAGLGMIEGEATHWMPLPEPPKEEPPC